MTNKKEIQMTDSIRNNKIWVVDDDNAIRFIIDRALTKEGFICETFSNAESVLKKINNEIPDCILSDIKMSGIDGISMLKEIHKKIPYIPVIIMTAHSDLMNAVNSYENGSFEYLPKPFDLDDCIAIVKKAVSQKIDKAITSENTTNDHQKIPEIIGESPAMQDVYRVIGRLSHSNVSVLITGESGTGKELVAHAIHNHSTRKEKPFVALNMAAIPHELIESELFGHEKGSFTGASNQRIGRFEEANTGTLFLDEIGDMPLEAQTRLLRVLENHEFYRVGGQQAISVDVRIIAATNKNLLEMIKEGKFREDLYFRLNVICIKLPPLRNRPEDIHKLAQVFLERAAKELNTPIKNLNSDVEKRLKEYSWPGNVRQLQNICRWISVMAPGITVTIEDLPSEFKTDDIIHNPDTTKANVDNLDDNSNIKPIEVFEQNTLSVNDNKINIDTNWGTPLSNWVTKELTMGHTNIQNDAQIIFEKIMLKEALRFTHGRKQEAAKILGLGRNTLTRKLKVFGDNDSVKSK